MKLFHLVDTDSIDSTMRNGLKRGSQGEFSQDARIQRVNRYLDEHRPLDIKLQTIRRRYCIYFYFATNTAVHDIADGSYRPLPEWLAKQSRAVVQAEVDTAKAFISDLNAYDALAEQFDALSVDRRQELAATYWNRVRCLKDVLDATNGTIPPEYGRIEILVTYDIGPNAITRVK